MRVSAAPWPARLLIFVIAPQLSDVNARSTTDQEDTVTDKKLNKLMSKARLEGGEISVTEPLVSKVSFISVLALIWGRSEGFS